MATLSWSRAFPWRRQPEPAQTDLSPGRDVTACDGERALLHRAAAGQREAVEEMVEQYQDTLYSMALTFTRDPHQAEDLTQEAWIRVLRALPGFRGECRFSTWLYRITMNLFLSRRPTREESLPDGLESSKIDPELLRLESSMAVIQSVRTLPPEFRAVVALRFIADLSYQEIAIALEVPLGTVQSRLKRGLERLGQELKTSHPLRGER